MPGIAGILRVQDEGDGARLEAMLTSMRHGSHFQSGVEKHAELGTVGWTGESGRDCFAAKSSDDKIRLIVVGQLAGSWRNADGRRLIEDYRSGNVTTLGKLGGAFSGILIDLHEKRVQLFNDRYGLSRIYYHINVNGFYFASEAKALLTIFSHLRELDNNSLAEQFSCGCVLQNRSLFRQISLLPGGSSWTVGPEAEIARTSYFRSSDWESQPALNDSEYQQLLTETFSNILPRYFADSENLGMSLTGGLDGRMIMAWEPENAGQFPCYTFGSNYRECADVQLARRVANVTGHPHRVIPVGESFLKQFSDLASETVSISDGTMDVSGAVELYANRLARQIAPIRLTGNYGSEILRYNVAFRPVKGELSYLSPPFRQLGRQAEDTYREESSGHPLSFIAFKQVPWHHYSRYSIEQSQLSPRTPFLDPSLVSLSYRVPRELSRSTQPAMKLIADGNKALAHIPTDRGVSLLSNLMVNKLRNSWQEFTVRSEYAYDYGMPRKLARMDHRLRALHLERLFLGRHKFYHFRIWYRDQLAGYVRELLLDEQSLQRPYLARKRVEQIVAEHTGGRSNHTLAIHKLLTIELLHRELLAGRN